jgi:hypothetical protein
MQRNEMGGVGVHHVAWDEDFFEKAFAQAWQCIQTVTVHQKPLVRFRVICVSLVANEQIPRGIEPKKYDETRYGSRVTMSERMIITKPIYEKFQEAEVTVFSFVDVLGSNQVFQYVYHMRLWITVTIVTDNVVYVVSFWWRGEG